MTPYGGDAALQAALKSAGVTRELDEIKALARGVAAAPEALDPDAWLALAAPHVDGALADELQALCRAYRDEPDGLSEVDACGARVAALREELARRKLDGFIIPLADEHQGEYVARRSQRLAWLTGFTGSAGIAIVLTDRAAIFVDGRYTLQAEQQVDDSLFARCHVSDTAPDSWLAKHLKSGQQLGYDPWLHTLDQRDRFAAATKSAGATLVAVADNPIDAVWQDQPSAPLGPVHAHDARFAGQASAEKRAEIAHILASNNGDASVLSAPDSIAWLLNVRGGDVACCPLPHSFAIVHNDAAVDWFVDARKLMPGVAATLGNAVTIQAPEALADAIAALGETKATVQVDPANTPVWIVDRLLDAGARAARGTDPCVGLKARKNESERAGTRAAHVRDGAALTRFLAWLDREGPSGKVHELTAVKQLGAMRAGGEHYRGPSFDTISGAGPNGAIVHYRVSEKTDRALESGSLYLVDSGGQYLDGTTDVTRTVAIGTPNDEHRDRFTRVLKGHIALGMAHFPAGTSGAQLDALARQYLWAAGLDYDHGTGHGVGSYLNVHEGPQRISKLPNNVALEPGMIVSNEPGYYKTGEYGIRIENLVLVRELPNQAVAERPMLGFETLTLAPIDRTLIATAMLSADERNWLNTYHARVRETLSPLLGDDANARVFLEKACAALD